MRLFHRTTREAAAAIAAEGFRDATGSYGTANEYSGVWVSSEPLDANEGAFGDVLLSIDGLSEAEIKPFESSSFRPSC